MEESCNPERAKIIDAGPLRVSSIIKHGYFLFHDVTGRNPRNKLDILPVACLETHRRKLIIVVTLHTQNSSRDRDPIGQQIYPIKHIYTANSEKIQANPNQ